MFWNLTPVVSKRICSERTLINYLVHFESLVSKARSLVTKKPWCSFKKYFLSYSICAHNNNFLLIRQHPETKYSKIWCSDTINDHEIITLVRVWLLEQDTYTKNFFYVKRKLFWESLRLRTKYLNRPHRAKQIEMYHAHNLKLNNYPGKKLLW